MKVTGEGPCVDLDVGTDTDVDLDGDGDVNLARPSLVTRQSQD
jgi:hypothetical protein